MRRLATAACALVLVATGCSSTVSIEPTGGENCLRERKQKVVGITYRTEQHFVDCNTQ